MGNWEAYGLKVDSEDGSRGGMEERDEADMQGFMNTDEVVAIAGRSSNRNDKRAVSRKGLWVMGWGSYRRE